MDIAYAQTTWLVIGQTYQLDDIIRVAIALVIFISWMLAVFFIIWWWVMLILSGWKEDKVKPATNSIRYSVIWLIIIILAVFITPKLGDMLGLNVSKYVSPDVIFSTIQDLSTKFFWSKNEINLDPGNTNSSLPSDFSDL
ncbi:MAG: hypothetical protein ACD_4C00342G0003 [uncultured bacterium (gcode 4)]|uniref:Uncharacterized protein n=1 Tax=uncultured bacterium (gcode 4) TaxID=1234023 RepID=K2GSK8_9BACT|nr:MAG: hypothetical protein ACD_4C00342G0003 [uncultured bacterium (gcode 4)]